MGEGATLVPLTMSKERKESHEGNKERYVNQGCEHMIILKRFVQNGREMWSWIEALSDGTSSRWGWCFGYGELEVTSLIKLEAFKSCSFLKRRTHEILPSDSRKSLSAYCHLEPWAPRSLSTFKKGLINTHTHTHTNLSSYAWCTKCCRDVEIQKD